jgi:hypothetical protein
MERVDAINLVRRMADDASQISIDIGVMKRAAESDLSFSFMKAALPEIEALSKKVAALQLEALALKMRVNRIG